MSSINPIASTKVAATGTNGAAQPQALQGSSSGVFANGVAGANFWDMILSQITPGGLTKTSTAAMETAAKTNSANLADNAAQATAHLKTENSLAALQVALASQTMDDKGNIVLANAASDAEKLQGQLDLTNQIINHLKNALPENAEKDGIFGKILSKLQSKSDTLQASLSALENGTITKDTPVEEIPLPLLISLGLTPAQISEVTQKIDALEEKLGREITVEDLIAGVGGVIAPAPEAAPIAMASLSTKQTAAAPSALDAIDDATQPTDDLAAQLNALDVGGEDTSTEKSLDNADGKRQMQGLPEQSVDKDMGTNTDTKVKKDMTTFKENLVNMMNGNKSQQGDMTFPISYFGSDTDSTIFQPFGLSATPSLSLGTTAQAANMISSGATAGQAHPATQIVAATLTKAGKDGSDNVMTLRLDPPELGNVNIRLQFGKEKSVKAVITVEKPETFMMLQRDGQALERALQSAGLDANADSISFQMSPDNGNLAQDNNGQGGNGNNYGGSANAQDANGAEIIQSSVAWQVDPSTGHVRYNIFA